MVLLVTFSITFYFVDKRQERLLWKQVYSQARALFSQIILTRRWIADHGGIFVEKLPWVTENPYLKDPVIVDVSGKVYVKENPAYVTRQLSEYAKKEGLYWFHITSLKPVNPLNKPDEFEKDALIRFEKEGLKELSTIETSNGIRLFRYIAPLYVEPACLECHKEYRLGDVRGAISISLPIDHLYKEILQNRIASAVGGVFISLMLLALLYFSLKRLVINPLLNLKEAMDAYERRRLKEYVPETEDEIGALQRTFKRLIQTIESYQEDLQNEVERATSVVKKTNKELLRLTEEYKKLSQRKSEYISAISHELRTPLTSIKGAVDYIQTRMEELHQDCLRRCEFEDIQNFVELISSNTARLIRMVNETLDLEKIETGRVEFYFNKVELNHLLNEFLMEVLPLLKEKRIALRTEIEESLMVMADEDRLKQVLFNLINNAVQHSPEGETIWVEGYRSGQWVIVRIKDNGPGVPVDKQKRIFDRFYKERREGTGLGLTISKGIIEAHGGVIGVVSDGKRGSIFYFKLPAAEESTYAKDSGNR